MPWGWVRSFPKYLGQLITETGGSDNYRNQWVTQLPKSAGQTISEIGGSDPSETTGSDLSEIFTLVGMINSDNIITVYEFLGLENIAGQLAKVSDNELVVHYLILQSIYDPPQFKEACAKLKQVVPERKENAGDLAQARKMEAVMEIIFPLIKLQEDSVYFVEEFGNALRLPQDLVNSYKTKAQSKKPNPFQKLRNKFSSDEICHTTEVEREMHNLQKCIDAGYDLIVTCSNDQKTVAVIAKKARESFDSVNFAKMQFLEPEQLFSYLDQQIAQEATTEARIKGYRVKVEYSTISEADMVKKKETVGRAILNSLNKQ